MLWRQLAVSVCTTIDEMKKNGMSRDESNCAILKLIELAQNPSALPAYKTLAAGLITDGEFGQKAKACHAWLWELLPD